MQPSPARQRESETQDKGETTLSYCLQSASQHSGVIKGQTGDALRLVQQTNQDERLGLGKRRHWLNKTKCFKQFGDKSHC